MTAAELIRALSASKRPVEWPPRIGARIHYNSGHPLSSWTGVVRAVVDDEVAVILKMHRDRNRSRYDLLERGMVEVMSEAGKPFRYGSLPKALIARRGR